MNIRKTPSKWPVIAVSLLIISIPSIIVFSLYLLGF